jgi:serine/threonine protein kinase
MTVLSGALMGNNENQTSLGKYQLIASLGQGGMAKVYLALVSGPAGVNKLIVVKVVQNEMLSGPEGGLALFWDEARLATRLVHPNIVHTYEVGEVDGNYFLAMEYLDGQTYRVLQARASQEPLPLHEALRILSEIARGLHYAHELRDFHGEPLGVVHRDVSPQNVFLTYDGQVKLIDFGIAKTRDADHETRVGLIKGKLNYIAPEQLRGDVLDRRADVFALGIMLWEAIAGRRFAGGPGVSEVAKVHARIKGEEPNIRVVKPGVAEELAAIIDRAIALDRDQRFDDAASFADALDAYIEGTGQRPSAKTLSSWMHSLFEQDRAAMHKVIEQRIQALLQRSPGGAVSDMPILPVAEEGNTGSGILKGRNLRLLGSGRPAAPSTVDGAVLGRDRARLRWAAAGMGLVVSAAAAAALLAPSAADHGKSGAPESAPEAAVSAASGHVAAAAPAAPMVEKVSAQPFNASVSVTVSPPNAQVSIDGALIGAPFKGAFPKGATLHRVEATAPGHRPYVRLVAFNQDREITIALEPVAEPARKSAPARARTSSERHSPAPERHVNVIAPSSAQEDEPRAAVVSDEPARPANVAPGGEIRPAKTRLGRSQLDTADPYSN